MIITIVTGESLDLRLAGMSDIIVHNGVVVKNRYSALPQ